MITPYHIEFLKYPLALWIGSSDSNHIPDSIRCLGVIPEDESILRCFIAERFSEKSIRNLSENKNIALAVSHPYTFVGYQYKGEVLELIPSCTPEEIEFQKRYMDEFAGSMANFGLDKQSVIDMYYSQPSVSIRMKVNKIFDQAPKPNTGGEALI